jgi:Phage integrase, N-terminal SAM-like domain
MSINRFHLTGRNGLRPLPPAGSAGGYTPGLKRILRQYIRMLGLSYFALQNPLERRIIMRQVIRRFLKHLDAEKNASASTIDTYRYDLTKFDDYLARRL